MGVIPRKEPMLIEVGRGLSADACAETIDEIGGKYGVHGADVHLAWMVKVARFDKVFDERFGTKDDVFKAFQLLHAPNESIHFALTLCEFHRAILIPKAVVTHHGIGFAPRGRLPFKKLFGQFVKGIVAQSRGAHHQSLRHKVGYFQLHHHVIHTQRPFSIGQLGVFLRDVEVLDKVHIAAFGDGKFGTLQMQSRVGQNIKFATEAEILLVVGQELQMIAKVVVHIHRVFDVITIKRDGVFAYGAGERKLQQAHLIVV